MAEPTPIPPRPTLTEVAPTTTPEATPNARLRPRHMLMIVLFLGMFAIPSLVATWYLHAVAADQYHSRAAFAVRSEEYSNPLDVLGAFTQTGTGAGGDNDILYDFIHSQPLIESIDAELDLQLRFNRAPDDWVFSLGEDRPVEDLVQHWERMVSVALDGSTKLIELEVRAFTPEDAQVIARAIIAQSERLVNELSLAAREDATRFAREDLETAEVRLRDIRLRVRAFRAANRLITPEADLESRTGVMAALEAQLAAALVDRNVLNAYAAPGDARRAQLDRRIDAIRSQITAERDQTADAGDARPLADIIGEYEELLVDLEFSNAAYTAALAAEEQARAEARRNSRYLAIHIPPTLSEAAQYPQRALLSLMVAAFLFAAWAVTMLIAYNIRDRR